METELDYAAIGGRIRQVRTNLGMTQDLMAERTGFSNPHISNIENGKTKLSLPAVICIANVLGVTVDQLLCDCLQSSNHIYRAEIYEILQDCSSSEIRMITELVRAAKASLRKVYQQ